MFIKLHIPGQYDKYLLAAEHRTELNDLDRIRHSRYMKGYIGETMFYEQIKDIERGIKIWDLSLKHNGGESQYDFIIIGNESVTHFDIKNYTGQYTYEDHSIISSTGYVHKDLLTQLTTSHYRLNQFLKRAHVNYTLNSRILFINPNFELINGPDDKRILYSHHMAQIKEYIATLDVKPVDMRVGEYLVSSHSNKNIYDRIHYYPFESLRIGARCPKCRKIGIRPKNNKTFMICSCGHEMRKQDIIQQTYDEISILKNGPVKTSEIARWTGISDRSVRRYLNTHYVKIGSNKDAQYIRADTKEIP